VDVAVKFMVATILPLIFRSARKPVVPTLGHMNGVSIYPFDMAVRCKQPLDAWQAGAWDTSIKKLIIKEVCDASALIQQIHLRVGFEDSHIEMKLKGLAAAVLYRLE
jgi:hypothetical protein